jgi:hypothetical protein
MIKDLYLRNINYDIDDYLDDYGSVEKLAPIVSCVIGKIKYNHNFSIIYLHQNCIYDFYFSHQSFLIFSQYASLDKL